MPKINIQTHETVVLDIGLLAMSCLMIIITEKSTKHDLEFSKKKRGND